MTEHATLPLADLVFDYDLYPRHDIDATHVNELVETLAIGNTVPPPIVDRASKRVVDGFHRVTAYRKVDPNASIEVELRDYASDQDLYVDAVKLNAAHARKLSNWDRVRVLRRLKELGVTSLEERATVLNVSVERAEKLEGRVSKGNGSKPQELKATVRNFAGKRMSKKQRTAAQRAGGMQQTFYVNQVINLLEGDLLDVDNAQLMERLAVLTTLLNQFGSAAA